MTVLAGDRDQATTMRDWAFGVQFDLLDLNALTQFCAARSMSASFAYVATPNAAFLVRVYRGDTRMMRGLDNADLVVNDSRVTQRLARLLLGKSLPLATGSDLTRQLFAKVILPDDPIIIVGGNEITAQRLRDAYGLRDLMQIIPTFGFINQPDEVARCVEFVRSRKARFIFIACGAPQSEMLAVAIREGGGAVGLGLCIGASLEFITGQQRRAPMIWQRLGLEWLYRVLQEPRRLGRRLLTEQLPFLAIALRYRLSPPDVPTTPDCRTQSWPIMTRFSAR